jgi:RNA-directed DNA polymerase
VTQHFSLQPSFSENLFERTLQRENIQAAWKRVRANKGAAGIDGMTIEEFPDWVRSGQWERVTQELRSGIYKPDPVRRVEIEKPDGGIRQLGIPTIKDRVIQQAIAPSRFKRRGSRPFLILLSQVTVLDLGQTEMGNKPVLSK